MFLLFKRPAYRYSVVIGGIFVILAIGSFLTRLEKDTSIDALMRADHPAVVSRDRVEQIFGLRDPIILAVVDQGPGGLFDAESLNLVLWLTEQLARVPNVDPDRVTSLATVTNVANDGDVLRVEPFYDGRIETDVQAAMIGQAVRCMPVYLGSLVAQDGSGTLISVELIDQGIANQTYQAILDLVGQAPAGGAVYVAGEAAVSGFLSEYIDRDSRKLVPLGFLAVFVIIYLTFRTVAAVGLSLVVVIASVVSAIGLMAAAGVPYFVITNALPSILVGVSVADAIHIVSAFYERRAHDPDGDKEAAAWEAIRSIFRPVLFTTLTTVFGFLGIVLSSSMPPMFWFGVFAIVGLVFAFVYSAALVPVGLAVIGRGRSPSFATHADAGSRIGRALSVLGLGAVRHSAVSLSLATVVFAVCVVGALAVDVDREQIGQFRPGESIVLADREINTRFDGSNYLDIVVQSDTPGGVLTPDAVARITALKDHAQTLAHVKSATSIVDYLLHLKAQLHADADTDAPLTAESLSQYAFLLTSSGDQREWEQRIDAARQQLLVRLQIDTGRFSDSRAIVTAMRQYLETHFDDDGLSAYLSGRINVDYQWLKPLAHEHAVSIGVSLALVLASAIFLFRSVARGLLTVIPVTLSIACVYGVMGFFGIWLDAATSMFATIAIGIGIDFGIHTVDRIEHFQTRLKLSFEDALSRFLRTCGRALFVNFIAIVSCFLVIGSSNLPTMQRFGMVCAMAISVSFLASITILPALLARLNTAPRKAGPAGRPSYAG